VACLWRLERDLQEEDPELRHRTKLLDKGLVEHKKLDDLNGFHAHNGGLALKAARAALGPEFAAKARSRVRAANAARYVVFPDALPGVYEWEAKQVEPCGVDPLQVLDSWGGKSSPAFEARLGSTAAPDLWQLYLAQESDYPTQVCEPVSEEILSRSQISAHTLESAPAEEGGSQVEDATPEVLTADSLQAAALERDSYDALVELDALDLIDPVSLSPAQRHDCAERLLRATKHLTTDYG